MRAGQPSSRPAHMRHWWNGIVIQSRVDLGVQSTHPCIQIMPCSWLDEGIFL